MKQWLNEPKNQPIVYGILALVMVCAIVFILYYVGVFGNSQTPYVPPAATAVQSNGPPPNAASPSTPPTEVRPGPSGPVASAPSAPGHLTPATVQTSSAPPVAPTSVRPGPSGPVSSAGPLPAPAANGGPGRAPAANAPVVVAALPDARKDPFAPYGGVLFIQHRAPRIRVDTISPMFAITSYSPPSPHPATPPVPGFANGQQGTAVAYAQPTGVILGNGAYALVNSNGQSLVLQPGEQYPGGGILYSIESDSVTVKNNGQLIKVPVSTSANSPQGGPNGPGPNGPNGPGGPGYNPNNNQ